MRNIGTFRQANEILATYIKDFSTYNLDGMTVLMSYLGNPQNKLKIIHVAGTSGKTSTSYYVAALLKAAGHSVGLSASPHIDEVNERVQIDMIPLEEAEYCRELSTFLNLIDASGLQPSYFELLVAFAYWEFDKKHVDYAVMEVGLGGLLDSTNVANRADKICLITDIGLDHMHILGDTLPLITAQKAGIIYEGNTIFMHEQSKEVINVVHNASVKYHAPLHVIPRENTPDKSLKSLPPFQRRNIGLAIEATNFALRRDYAEVLRPKAIQNAVKTYIPGRMEIRTLGDKAIVLDGSHNEQKIGALVEGMQERFPDTPMTLLVSFGLLKEPSVLASLKLLRTLSSRIIVTQFHKYQDESRAALDPKILATLSKEAGFTNITVAPDPQEALRLLINTNTHLGLITGSFYLLNHYRNKI